MRPVAAFLHGKNIKPSTISLIGLLMVVPFIYFLPINGWVASVFILLSFFLDSVDGVLARFAKIESKEGEFIDHCFDYLSFFVIFLTFLANGLTNGFWSALYLLNYVIMLVFVIYCNGKNIKIFYVVKTKYIIYGLFLFYLIVGVNLFDPFLVFCSIYMIVTNLFLFDRIRCSLR